MKKNNMEQGAMWAKTGKQRHKQDRKRKSRMERQRKKKKKTIQEKNIQYTKKR